MKPIRKPQCFWRTIQWVCLAICLMHGLLSSQTAIAQTLEIRPGWNLIALPKEPLDSTIEAVFKPLKDNNSLIAVWSLARESNSWELYPAPLPGIATFNEVHMGNAYWLNASTSAVLELDGETIVAGGTTLYKGWNLIGFPLVTPKPFRELIANLPIEQIWRYNAETDLYEGIERIPGTTATSREDFTEIEPGVGYWIYTPQQVVIGPTLKSFLPPDTDASPLLTKDSLGSRTLWVYFSLGDEDLGGDGFYDFSDTQRHISLLDHLTTRSFSIVNGGTGILNWRAELVSPQDSSWLRFTTIDAETGSTKLTTFVEGSLTNDTAAVQIHVDRSYLVPGHYTGQIRIVNNSIKETDHNRLLTVHMVVAPIDGEYDVRVKIETINGHKADIHNPEYRLSIYQDAGGLKGIIDDSRSLLMPSRFYFTGHYFQNNSNHFTLNGSSIWEAYNPALGRSVVQNNPFATPLRRDITLYGDRPLQNSTLGPLDLKGEYFETIRNVLGKPIEIQGTFEATRVDSRPQTRDEITYSRLGDDIPDRDGNTVFDESIEITDKLLLTEVDLELDIVHTRPHDLKVTLVSPLGTEVILRRESSLPTEGLIYDETALPLESLEMFQGEVSQGTWHLLILDNVPGASGTLRSYKLKLKGTKLYAISGVVQGATPGTKLLLTGCGYSALIDLNVDGSYHLDGMVNCNYALTIISPEMEQTNQTFTINGSNQTINLTATRHYAPGIDFQLSSQEGNQPVTVNMVDISSLPSGGNYQYQWKVYRHQNGGQTLMQTLPENSSSAAVTFPDPGIYSIEMNITDAADPNAGPWSLHATDRLIHVGRPQGVDYKYETITLYGFAGTEVQPYASDSATWDIDRLPMGGAIGLEDSNAFSSRVDIVTGTNAQEPNTTIDGPKGEGSVKATVSIGQTVIGISFSGVYQLAIGQLHPNY